MKKKTNILFILIDDLGCRDLGAFGSTFYETPHLDRLAEQGMTFDRAYASCPVCSLTRASILSRKYPARVGVTQWIGGRVLQTLDEEGLADNTLVVFTSDNGGLSTAQGAPTCNLHCVEGKGWNFEGGTRVCQMARWPGVIPPRSSTQEPVTSTDFYPTFLEAAGLPPRPEQHCDGVSLLPVLRGESQPLPREAIFWHYPHYSGQGGRPAASMVEGDWKMIECFETGRIVLFNLREDPGEQQDLAEMEPERLSRMANVLKTWQREIEAKIPKPIPDYERLIREPGIPNNAFE